MSVLIIFEAVPESIDFYVVDESHPIVELAAENAGKYAGSGDEPESVLEFQEMLASDAIEAAKLSDDAKDDFPGDITRVITTGVLM